MKFIPEKLYKKMISTYYFSNRLFALKTKDLIIKIQDHNFNYYKWMALINNSSIPQRAFGRVMNKTVHKRK